MKNGHHWSLTAIFWTIFSFQSFAQTDVSPVWVSKDLLKKHVYTLASDSLQGRGSGTVGQFKAADYCVKDFKNSHLLPIFQLDSLNWSFLQKYYFTPSLVAFFGRMAVTAKRSELSDPPSPNYSDSRILFAHNVGGLIVGKDLPNETVIVSAHYDHLGKIGSLIYNGADDNASGSASVLAIAAAFDSLAQQGIRPRRSVLFLLFSGEEGGLIGSKYFVANSPIPMNQIICDLNVDMVGRTDFKHRKKPDYCYLITGKQDNELRQTIKTANQKSVNINVDHSYDSENDPSSFYYRSDHYNFAKQGIPIAFFMDGEHPDYHQPSDSADKINYPLLQKRATLVFQTAWMMANP
ncbi:M20/M25/M40 family metallo-hydrolase [Runella sp.]|uniref:M20/M25/M40 family metallo-hydrolase n=1 Tax=Runella sp. TaxID=1960881 RepID=UPI003D0D73C5